MSEIPILKVGPVLLVSVQTELNDRVATNFQESLLTRIKATGAIGTLIDITALDVVDSFIGRVLSETAKMARVMNAKVVLVGMRPAVAITLLEMGLDLPDIEAEGDVEAGLRALGYALMEMAVENGKPIAPMPPGLQDARGNGQL